MLDNKTEKVVFILGAGCSQEDKVPLINDFLDTSKKVMNFLNIQQKEKFQNIFNFRNQVLPESNIEELFSYIDLERYIYAKSNNSEYDLGKIRNELLFVIAKTIEKNITRNRSENYKNFINNHVCNSNKSIIITFNWELLLDNVIFDKIGPFNSNKNFNIYGADFNRIDENGVHDIGKAEFKLLKLHGSLNWLRCRDCERNNRVSRFFVSGKESVLNILEGQPKQCLIDKRYYDPIIVPPSFQKIEPEKGLSFLNDVWLEAKNALIEADRINIIGYSFPEDDVHFKYFFRGALVSNYRKRNKKQIKVNIINFKKYTQDKLDFEKHYNEILTIPDVKIDVDFKYQKFSEYTQNNH